MDSYSQDELSGSLLAQRYQVGQCIRRSELQRLYKAQDVESGASVHLKVLRPARPVDTSFREGFKRQFARISAISHPNVLVPIDFGFADDKPFIVTPSFTGVSLHEALELEGRFPAQRVSDLAEQIADAIGAGHAAGVVHGNLSSHSIILVDGFSESEQAYVLDFGISHFFSADDSGAAMTDNGKLIGLPEFIAPEQIRGLPIDPATDIYALATVLYELLSGTVPFPIQGSGAEAVMDVLIRQANDAPPPLPAGIGAGEELERALRSALAKDPSERPQTVAEFTRRFAEANSGLSDFSLPPSSDQMLLDTSAPMETAEEPLSYVSPFSGFEAPQHAEDVAEEKHRTTDEFDSSPSDDEEFTRAWMAPQFEASAPSAAESTSEEDKITEPSAEFDWLSAVREEEQRRQRPTELEQDTVDPFADELSQVGDAVEKELDFSQETPQFIPPEPQRQARPPRETVEEEPQHFAPPPHFKSKRSLGRRLVLPFLGIGIVALVVLAAGLLLKKQGPSEDPEQRIARNEDPGMPEDADSFTAPDEAVDSSPDEVVNPRPSPPQATAAPDGLQYGTVDLEDIILKSDAGRALAQDYERAYRAVNTRDNKKMLLQELHKSMTEAVREIRKDLESLVGQYGEANGFGLIVGKGGDPSSTLYADSSVDPAAFIAESGKPKDISREILETYNELMRQ